MARRVTWPEVNRRRGQILFAQLITAVAVTIRVAAIVARTHAAMPVVDVAMAAVMPVVVVAKAVAAMVVIVAVGARLVVDQVAACANVWWDALPVACALIPGVIQKCTMPCPVHPWGKPRILITRSAVRATFCRAIHPRLGRTDRGIEDIA